MRNPESLLAVGPGEKRPELKPVTTQTFIDYALGLTPEPHYSQFAESLSLPEITPFLRELDSFDHEVYVYSEKERSQVFEYNENPHESLLWKKVREEVMEEAAQERSKKAQGERFTVISFDWNNLEWGREPIVGGSYDHVSLNRSEYYADVFTTMRQPVFEVHTHPDTSLFSPYDYHNLIAMLPNGQRLQRGMIVLCPDMQIMALTTKHTPLYRPERIPTVMEQWKENLKNSSSETLLMEMKRYEGIDAFVTGYYSELEEVVKNDIAALDARQKQDPLPEDEYVEATSEIYFHHRPTMREDVMWHDRILESAEKRFANEASAVLNGATLKLARDLHIMLYTSQDMTNFTAFSA